VRLRLTPRDTSFYDQFAASARNIVDAAEVLAQMVASTSVSDRGALNQRMRDIEHANDEVTHEVMRKLNSTFVTPFDREDIYRLTAQLDDVVDFMEAAADLILLYELDELPETTREVVGVLVKAAQATAEAMPRLQEMKGLEEYWIEVNRLENEADQLYRRTVAKLFNGQYDALMAIKLKDLADQVEAAADALEDVADTVETIALKES
jgi:predicted phosphate transport protein (TIGR00153 family)